VLGALFIAAVSLGLWVGTSVAAPAAAQTLRPELATLLTERGKADFVVEFKETPDLSPALGMSWEERGQFVVKTLEAANARLHAPARRYLAGRNLRHESFLVGNLLYVFDGDETAARWLAALPEVKRVREPITLQLPPITVNEAMPLVQGAPTWGLNDTGATRFWTTFGVKGADIVVANIDSGVQYDHPALIGQFKCASPTDAKCWRDPRRECGSAGACDKNGHGTHTMGTMVAKDDNALPHIAGMAPQAKWIACKGCSNKTCSEFSLNTCADWILSPGGSPADRPHVVNNSWGGTGGDDWYRAKVVAWQAAGIFPAFSAGNAGPRCNTLGSPGDYQESFASAAHDSNRAIASFSSRGPSPTFGHDPYTKPNISAPGVGVISTVPTDGWASLNGTSMASPHTAGAVALLWSCNPALKGQIAQTIQLLQNTAGAAPVGNCGVPPDGQGNYTYGYGYLDVLAAGLQACGGTPTPKLSVAAIAPSASCTSRSVTARVNIVDDSAQPVGGAAVTGTWTRPSGGTMAMTQGTDTAGVATFNMRALAKGTYQFCVDGVTKSGFTYDAGANVETCDTVVYSCQ
jgi:subtilisin family serine protease